MPLHAGNLASGPYYTEAVKALRGNRHACNLLGEPLRFQALKLGDQENRVTTEHAQVDYGESSGPRIRLTFPVGGVGLQTCHRT